MSAAQAAHAGQTEALVDAYNAHKRPHSLLEAHQIRMAKEAKAAKKSKSKPDKAKSAGAAAGAAGAAGGAAGGGDANPPCRVRAPHLVASMHAAARCASQRKTDARHLHTAFIRSRSTATRTCRRRARLPT
jgi:hypothetical protein